VCVIILESDLHVIASNYINFYRSSVIKDEKQDVSEKNEKRNKKRKKQKKTFFANSLQIILINQHSMHVTEESVSLRAKIAADELETVKHTKQFNRKNKKKLKMK